MENKKDEIEDKKNEIKEKIEKLEIDLGTNLIEVQEWLTNKASYNDCSETAKVAYARKKEMERNKML